MSGFIALVPLKGWDLIINLKYFEATVVSYQQCQGYVIDILGLRLVYMYIMQRIFNNI